jgi:uncharacterized protein (TIRG00374 family)
MLVTLGCLIWIIAVLDWPAVWAALSSANLLWVGLGIVTVLLTIVARVARWRAFLYPQAVRWTNLLSAMLVGQLLNYFAPARAGDLVRAYILGDTEGESKVWTLTTVALEKLWDVWMLLGIVGLLSFSTALPTWLTAPARVMALLSILLLGVIWLIVTHRAKTVAGMAWLGRYFPPHLSVRLHRGVERVLDGLEGLRRRRAWMGVTVWSAATWGLGALTNYTVFRALHLSLPFSAALVLLVVLQLGVAVPSLPGRVGVFEGLCIVVLALFGIDRDAAFAAGLVLHVMVFVPPILLGFYYAGRERVSMP